MNITLYLLVLLLILIIYCCNKKIKQNFHTKNKKEGFFNIDNCLGRRDGVSGCRDCCRNYQDYNQCVSNCMNY